MRYTNSPPSFLTHIMNRLNSKKIAGPCRTASGLNLISPWITSTLVLYIERGQRLSECMIPF